MTDAGDVEADLRRQLLSTAQRLPIIGLSAAATGNVSVRCGDDLLITPSGIDYAELQAEDMVRLDATGRVSDGQRRPSSEWRVHRDLYRARPEFGAIVHSHSACATAIACQRRAIPPFHYMVIRAGGHDIRCAEYATFGTQQLSDNVATAMAGRSACLLANHGQIAAGPDLPGALRLAWEVEELARQFCYTLQLGEPVLLDDAELARVSAQFRDYGQQC
ncbi:L-fuculose-phosphate aldolase [Methylohalomonas lacus]|uniref:L-fuculose-phosphate aldolase n=1 Tax=Methylohalomonas lacus TaxID=398773 RepID=A0AAE3HKJ6_9GAMM|nr:class II aldolase/adducin family protein [Methylohalomonas lacus]MCS3902102.1 L-fuculose-phosphate aldolase [Methylohalomonas lacus]